MENGMAAESTSFSRCCSVGKPNLLPILWSQMRSRTTEAAKVGKHSRYKWVIAYILPATTDTAHGSSYLYLAKVISAVRLSTT